MYVDEVFEGKEMLKSSSIEFGFEDGMVDELSQFDFWDNENTAYVKMDFLNEKQIWVIYSADGVKLASTENRDLAYVMAKQNDYEVMSAH